MEQSVCSLITTCFCTFAGMKLKFLLIQLFLFSVGSLFAQNQPFKEVVYLKNGSIIRGSIVEWVPNESLTIQTADKSIFVCKIGDIERVKREIEEPQSPVKQKSITNTSGYESNIALGYGASSGKYGLDVLCFNWVFGKNLNKHHFIGGGTGVRHFDGIKMTMIPILVDYRYRINDNDIAPFVRLAAGYSINVSDGLDNSGFLVDPRIGMEIKLTNALLNIDFGYQTQQMAFLTVTDPFYLSKVYRFSESLKFSVGLSF